MQLIDLLKSYGFPKETIDTYIEMGMIKKNEDNTCFIDNGELLITLIDKCITYHKDPTPFIFPAWNGFGKELDVVYSEIYNKNYILAADECEVIKNKANTHQLSLLIDALRKHEDKNIYILSNSEYGNDEATRNGLKKMERKLLLELESGNFSGALVQLKMLSKIYQDCDSLFTNITSELLKLVDEFASSPYTISGLCDEACVGPSEQVLLTLLEKRDIYRAVDLVNEELLKGNYTIEWQVYFHLIRGIKKRNDMNLERAKLKCLVLACNNKAEQVAFKNSLFPCLSKEDLKKIEEKYYLIDKDKDYYSEYKKALYEDCNLKLAKEMIDKHVYKSIVLEDENLYDYLVEEVDLLIKNEEAGVNINEYMESLKLALNYLKNEDYVQAKVFTAKSHNLLKFKNPRVLALLGKVYYKTGDMKNAEKFYDEAYKGTISPEEIEDMIYVYYENKNYNKATDAINSYDYYNKKQNIKLHYLAASAYLHLKRYDDSLEEIKMCSSILDGDGGLPIQFVEEKEIINKAKKQYDVSFDLEDYVDYEIERKDYFLFKDMKDNMRRVYRILEDFENDIYDNYKENLKFVLTMIKLLVYSCEYDQVMKVCTRLDDSFDKDLLPNNEAKNLTKMLNNLKKCN